MYHANHAIASARHSGGPRAATFAFPMWLADAACAACMSFLVREPNCQLRVPDVAQCLDWNSSWMFNPWALGSLGWLEPSAGSNAQASPGQLSAYKPKSTDLKFILATCWPLQVHRGVIVIFFDSCWRDDLRVMAVHAAFLGSKL